MPSNPPNPSTRAPSVNPGWPLNKYITSLLEGEGAEQNVHQLSDSFDAFQPLLAVNDHQVNLLFLWVPLSLSIDTLHRPMSTGSMTCYGLRVTNSAFYPTRKL